MTKQKKIFSIGILAFIVSGAINLMSGNTLVAIIFFVLSVVLIVKLISGK